MKPFGVTLPRDYFISLKKCSSKHAQFCQPISFYGQKLGGIYYFLLKKRTFADQFFWHNNNTIMLTCIFVCVWSFDGHFFFGKRKVIVYIRWEAQYLCSIENAEKSISPCMESHTQYYSLIWKKYKLGS